MAFIQPGQYIPMEIAQGQLGQSERETQRALQALQGFFAEREMQQALNTPEVQGWLGQLSASGDGDELDALSGSLAPGTVDDTATLAPSVGYRSPPGALGTSPVSAAPGLNPALAAAFEKARNLPFSQAERQAYARANGVDVSMAPMARLSGARIVPDEKPPAPKAREPHSQASPRRGGSITPAQYRIYKDLLPSLTQKGVTEEAARGRIASAREKANAERPAQQLRASVSLIEELGRRERAWASNDTRLRVARMRGVQGQSELRWFQAMAQIAQRDALAAQRQAQEARNAGFTDPDLLGALDTLADSNAARAQEYFSVFEGAVRGSGKKPKAPAATSPSPGDMTDEDLDAEIRKLSAQ